MVFVWTYFIELHNNRTSNGFGVNPIQFSEIKAYFELMGIEPDDWEVSVIKKLDNVALKQYAEEAKKQQEKNQQKSKSKK